MKHTKKHIKQNTKHIKNGKTVFERRTQIKKKKIKQRAGEYEDTKMLDFMKLGIGFDRNNIAPMPQPPECSIL
jgi:hypothetical protein